MDVKQVAQRATEAFNRHDVAAIRELTAEDCTFWGAGGTTATGREECVTANTMWFDACSDARITVTQLVAEGDTAAEEGDLVALDCGVILDGWQSDSGMTVGCGPLDAESLQLIEVTREALALGIAAAQPGGRMGDIGAAVSEHVYAARFSLLRDHGGHGIGRQMHEPPEVSNVGVRGQGTALNPGLVLAIEPIVNAGTGAYRVRDDGWTVQTADGRRSCYFEHTVAITEAGPQVLTLRSAERLETAPA